MSFHASEFPLRHSQKYLPKDFTMKISRKAVPRKKSKISKKRKTILPIIQRRSHKISRKYLILPINEVEYIQKRRNLFHFCANIKQIAVNGKELWAVFNLVQV
jgi:hypothetical protein